MISLPAGFNLIHLPLKVRAVDGVRASIESVSDLYAALGGAETVIYLFTRDTQAQEWVGYFGASDRKLTDDMGIIVLLITPVSLRLAGDALGTDGLSAIPLNLGLNLIGLPLRDSRITRVSDLLALEGSCKRGVPMLLA